MCGAGRPLVNTAQYTVFILEQWSPVPGRSDRTINVYSNAPAIRLELNGVVVAPAVKIEKYGMATFNSVAYKPGNLTAVALAEDGATPVCSAHVCSDAV